MLVYIIIYHRFHSDLPTRRPWVQIPPKGFFFLSNFPSFIGRVSLIMSIKEIHIYPKAKKGFLVVLLGAEKG